MLVSQMLVSQMLVADLLLPVDRVGRKVVAQMVIFLSSHPLNISLTDGRYSDERHEQSNKAA